MGLCAPPRSQQTPGDHHDATDYLQPPSARWIRSYVKAGVPFEVTESLMFFSKWVMMETWLVLCYVVIKSSQRFQNQYHWSSSCWPLWSRWPVEDPLMPVGRARHPKLWTMHPSCRVWREQWLQSGFSVEDYDCWLQYSDWCSDGSMSGVLR